MNVDSARKTARGWSHHVSRRFVSPNLRWVKGHTACAIERPPPVQNAFSCSKTYWRAEWIASLGAREGTEETEFTTKKRRQRRRTKGGPGAPHSPPAVLRE